MVGALAGTYLAGKSQIFKQIYWNKKIDSSTNSQGGSSQIITENAKISEGEDKKLNY